MSADMNEYGKSGGTGGGDAGETGSKGNDASKSGSSRSASEWINVLNRIIPPAGRGQAKHGVVLKKEAPQSSQFQAPRKENRSRDLTAAWQGLARQDAPFAAPAPTTVKTIIVADTRKPPVAEPILSATAEVEKRVAEPEKELTAPMAEQELTAETVVEEAESSYSSVAVNEREEAPVIAAESFESGVVEVRGVNQDDDLETRDDLMKKSKDSHGSVADSKTSKAMRDALVNQSHKTEAVERMVKSGSRDESRDRKPQKEQARSLADIAATANKKTDERDTSKEKDMKSKAAIEAMVGRAEQEESSEHQSAGSSDKTIRVKVEPLGSGIVSVVTSSAKGVTKIGKSAVNSIGDAASSAREKIAGRSKDSSGGGKGAFAAAGETAAKATQAAADAVVSLFKGVGTLAGYVATGAVAAPVDLANGIANAVKGVCKSGKKDESAD
ncbi:MAG: hypothetical protein HQK86_02755 [Nitrospinae bacterium]|nr:hypothetical protein [Nitrospinota bacterium]